LDTNVADQTVAAMSYTGKLRVRTCGICLDGKKILVVKHKNIAGKYNLWAPPGGGVQFGEKVKDCLVREFREETGLIVKPGRFLFMREFLQDPLHAIELFFEVHVVGGALKIGTDPELAAGDQLIADVTFRSLADLRKEKPQELHQIFADLLDLDDLYMPQHRFL
jgi:ADP-ribose pyrophosphatase YjhB (NUDIX family)